MREISKETVYPVCFWKLISRRGKREGARDGGGDAGRVCCGVRFLSLYCRGGVQSGPVGSLVSVVRRLLGGCPAVRAGGSLVSDLPPGAGCPVWLAESVL